MIELHVRTVVVHTGARRGPAESLHSLGSSVVEDPANPSDGDRLVTRLLRLFGTLLKRQVAR